MLINSHFEGSSAENLQVGSREKFIKGGTRTSLAQNPVPTIYCCDIARVTIDVLPDISLLEVFDFYLDEEQRMARNMAWRELVHVCRKWRNLVFESPRRLNLRIYWPLHIPVREILDVWPPLPIVIKLRSNQPQVMDNTFVLLDSECNNRICDLDLFGFLWYSKSERFLVAMQRPFPVLENLRLRLGRGAAPVDPDSFLGGSVPCLQALHLDTVPFPGLPKLILSATNLITLSLRNIPYSGYISPEAMATSLSTLTMLKTLDIGFDSPLFHRDQKSQLSPTRTLFSVLTELRINAAREYVEDLVARIDAPLLVNLQIVFFHDEPILHSPDFPRLTQFISCTPKFKACDEARVVLSDRDISITFPQTFDGALRLEISSIFASKFIFGQNVPQWSSSSVAQVSRSSFPQALVTAVERLYILDDKCSRKGWEGYIENSDWLVLLRSFTAVKDLFISSHFTPPISSALGELVEEEEGEEKGVAEVLPALRTLFLKDLFRPRRVPRKIEQFATARQLANHPISISGWKGHGF
jgi:hypothetical protein